MPNDRMVVVRLSHRVEGICGLDDLQRQRECGFSLRTIGKQLELRGTPDAVRALEVEFGCRADEGGGFEQTTAERGTMRRAVATTRRALARQGGRIDG